MGDQVHRAVEICVDSDRDLPAELHQLLLRRGQDLLINPTGPVALARRAVTGHLMEVGPARFAMDEQWWLTEPAEQAGQLLEFRVGDVPIWLGWHGEAPVRTSACAGLSEVDSTVPYGRIVRHHTFTLAREDAWILGRDGAASACGQLDCADPTVSADECVDACPGWMLPLAIAFQRVEPASPLYTCP